MAVGDVYRLTMQSLCQNNIYINTYTYRSKTAALPTQAEAAEVAQDTMNLSRPQQSTLVTWTTWELKQLWGADMTTIRDECRREGGHVYIGSFAEPNDGAAAAGDLLPPQCAMVVTLQTGLAGRRRRGRTYLFGFNEQVQVGGLWSSTFVANITSFFAGHYGEYGVGGTNPNWELGVWSERTASGCVPNPNGKGMINIETPHPELAYTPSTGFAVRSTVFSQRRRTLGVGR
jgi:hypothetical protein